ncbi:sirohydrochlorin chelatase [Cutibacterium sp. V947]|uniref:sirohydrochlorin chelatase n=1 Tax=Cutibacterium sp. V947 TaxID=3446480 RepID=UPI003EE12CED
MAAPVLDLVLPAMSEASATLIGQRLRQRMSHLHPHIESTVSFVPEKGGCKAPRSKPSWSELVLVPINVTHLHSSPPQLARHAEDIRRSHPDLAIRVARPTGPTPALLNLVDARLRLAAHRVHAQELDVLILSVSDSGDPRGAAMLSKMTRLWSQHHHLPVHIATNSGGATDVEEVVAHLRREGRRHIAVGSLWICDDETFRAHTHKALHAGAEVVSAPLGDDPVLAALAFERYCSAAMGLVSGPIGDEVISE